MIYFISAWEFAQSFCLSRHILHIICHLSSRWPSRSRRLTLDNDSDFSLSVSQMPHNATALDLALSNSALKLAIKDLVINSWTVSLLRLNFFYLCLSFAHLIWKTNCGSIDGLSVILYIRMNRVELQRELLHSVTTGINDTFYEELYSQFSIAHLMTQPKGIILGYAFFRILTIILIRWLFIHIHHTY